MAEPDFEKEAMELRAELTKFLDEEDLPSLAKQGKYY